MTLGTQAPAQPCQVTAYLDESPDTAQFVPGFRVKYVPILIGDRVPYIQSKPFSFDAVSVYKALWFDLYFY